MLFFVSGGVSAIAGSVDDDAGSGGDGFVFCLGSGGDGFAFAFRLGSGGSGSLFCFWHWLISNCWCCLLHLPLAWLL